MYHKLKNGHYWVWSSKKSSLDCMPRYKVISKAELLRIYKKHGLVLNQLKEAA